MPVPGTHTEPHGAPAVRARALNSPAAPGDDLFVVVPSYGAQRSLAAGWPPKTPPPAAGDDCLVLFDENRNPWVVAWAEGGEGGAGPSVPRFYFVTFTVLSSSAAQTFLARDIPLIVGQQQEKLEVASVGAGLTQLDLPNRIAVVGDGNSEKLSYGRVAAGTPATMTVYTFEAVAKPLGVGLSIIQE